MWALTRRQLMHGLMASPWWQSRLRDLLPGDEEALHPRLQRVTVPVPGLDRRLDGLRVGQVSDVHVGAYLGVDHLREALALLAPDPPEIMTVTGDLVDDASLCQACLDAVAQVQAPLGRFFVMGNHDNYAGRAEVLGTARAHPAVRLLKDEGVAVPVHGARIWVGGVDYPAEEGLGRLEWETVRSPFPHAIYRRRFPDMERDVAAALQGGDRCDFRLALAHHPDFFEKTAALGAELTLSGHTHGGQVAPVGSFLASEVFRYLLGLYSAGGRSIYVNGGTGQFFPLRVGIPAEVTLLTLARV